MGRLIDEYEDIKTQQECVSKTIDTLWKMAQKYQKIQEVMDSRPDDDARSNSKALSDIEVIMYGDND